MIAIRSSAEKPQATPGASSTTLDNLSLASLPELESNVNEKGGRPVVLKKNIAMKRSSLLSYTLFGHIAPSRTEPPEASDVLDRTLHSIMKTNLDGHWSLRTISLRRSISTRGLTSTYVHAAWRKRLQFWLWVRKTLHPRSKQTLDSILAD